MPDSNLSSFIWQVADLLRGDFKQSEYGKVILPFSRMRGLESIAMTGSLEGKDLESPENKKAPPDDESGGG